MKSLFFFKRILLSIILCGLLTPMMSYAQDESIRYEFTESSRSIMRVGPNQTLDQLVEQIYPQYREFWPQLKQEIRDRNPHAFSRYTGNLIPGQRLKLVTIRKIRETTVTSLAQVGDVADIQGFATVTDKNGNERRLQQKSQVYEGDRLTTAKGASLVVKMIDGAEMRIKQDSSVRITEYTMKSGFESGSASIIDLIKGGLRKITGSIGANPLSVYRFQTGVMTIGVRGTDYVVKICSENDCENSAGRNDPGARLHVVVLDGMITLMDEEGVKGELVLGQYAVATPDTKSIIDDASPVAGLLNAEEQAVFASTQAPAEPEKQGIWPWLIGGALLGIGI